MKNTSRLARLLAAAFFTTLFFGCKDLERLEKATPVASFSYKINGCDGNNLTYKFTAPRPVLADGDTYVWNFGDGSPTLTTTDSTVSHSFSSDKNFEVTLTISYSKCPTCPTAEVKNTVPVYFKDTLKLKFSKDYGDATAHFMAECPDGGILVVGEKPTAEGPRLFVLKLTAYGEVIFEKTISTTENAKGVSAVVEPNGDIFVCGYTEATINQPLFVKISQNGAELEVVSELPSGSTAVTPIQLKQSTNGSFSLLSQNTSTSSSEYQIWPLDGLHFRNAAPISVGNLIQTNGFEEDPTTGQKWLVGRTLNNMLNTNFDYLRVLMFPAGPTIADHASDFNTEPFISKHPDVAHFWVSASKTGLDISSFLKMNAAGSFSSDETEIKRPSGQSSAQIINDIKATQDGGCIFVGKAVMSSKGYFSFGKISATTSQPIPIFYKTEQPAFGPDRVGSTCAVAERLCTKGYLFAGRSNGQLKILRTNTDGDY